jgi:hypothetical protein
MLNTNHEKIFLKIWVNQRNDLEFQPLEDRMCSKIIEFD